MLYNIARIVYLLFAWTTNLKVMMNWLKTKQITIMILFRSCDLLFIEIKYYVITKFILSLFRKIYDLTLTQLSKNYVAGIDNKNENTIYK